MSYLHMRGRRHGGGSSTRRSSVLGINLWDSCLIRGLVDVEEKESQSKLFGTHPVMEMTVAMGLRTPSCPQGWSGASSGILSRPKAAGRPPDLRTSWQICQTSLGCPLGSSKFDDAQKTSSGPSSSPQDAQDRSLCNLGLKMFVVHRG